MRDLTPPSRGGCTAFMKHIPNEDTRNMTHLLYPDTLNPQPTETVWVDSIRLNSLLIDKEVQSWAGGPHPRWFLLRASYSCFLLPEISIWEEPDVVWVEVTNGRHRIRWLIDRGDLEIPVVMDSNDVERGLEIGLVTRRAQAGDILT